MRNARKLLEYGNQIREQRGVLDWVPCETDAEVELWCRKFPGRNSWKHTCGGWKKQDRAEEEVKLGDAVTMVSMDSKAQAFVPLHWAVTGCGFPGRKITLGEIGLFIRGQFLGRNSAVSLHQPTRPTAEKWEPQSKMEHLGGAPHHSLQSYSKEKWAHSPQDVSKAQGQGAWGRGGGMVLETEASRGSVCEKVRTSPQPWWQTEDLQCGELQPERLQGRDTKYGRVSWEAPENRRGEDNFLKTGRSTFWVVRPPAPAGRSLDREFISRETGQPKRKDLPQRD